LNAKIDSLAPIMADTYNEYTDLDIKISQYDSIENIESFKKTIDSLRDEISALKEIRDTNKIDLNIPEQEIQLVSTTIKDSIERTFAELQMMEDTGSRELAAISMFDSSVRIETVPTSSIKANILDIEKAIQEQETYKNLSTNYSLIPKECELKEQCPFVKDTVKYQKLFKGDTTLELLKRTLESEKKKLEMIEVNNTHMEETLVCKNKMTHIISQYNAHKPAFIALGLDLSNINQFEEFLTHGSTVTLETSNFENLKNIDSLIVSKSEQLEKFNAQYFELTKNIDMINSMKENREKIRIKYEKYTETLNNYKIELKAISEQILNYKQSILSDEELVSKYMVNLEIKKKYDSKSVRRDELYTSISKYKEAEDRLNRYLDAIRELNINKIPNVTNRLNELKYNLVLYQEYTKEYKEFSAKYSNIETIKKYTSPTSGIQTIFMNIYMNDIINISNKLLGMMFNGEFVLHPFIINETEFRIPCSGSGFLNDDISSMSTSQICLISTIISFALLHKSSSIYNIAMLDEIDGGLDNQNRLQFSNLITKLMKVLGFDQTIMISHNSELDLHSCDIIVMKQSDPTMKLNGNIIFKA
jgi:chromosome segregation ATPase